MGDEAPESRRKRRKKKPREFRGTYHLHGFDAERSEQVRDWVRTRRWETVHVSGYESQGGELIIVVQRREGRRRPGQVIFQLKVGPEESVREAADRERALNALRAGRI